MTRFHVSNPRFSTPLQILRVAETRFDASSRRETTRTVFSFFAIS